MIMEEEIVIHNIQDALNDLYLHEADLIINKTDERTIAAHLMHYLKPRFVEWSVDPEYNRDGKSTKENSFGNRIYPDIIIHHRTPNRDIVYSPENNLVVIELKGYWNKEDRSIDAAKLCDMKKKYGYQYLYRIELNVDDGIIIEVQL